VQYITPAVGQDVNIAKDGVTEVNFKVDAGKAKVN
jgi:hypothetical protein